MAHDQRTRVRSEAQERLNRMRGEIEDRFRRAEKRVRAAGSSVDFEEHARRAEEHVRSAGAAVAPMVPIIVSYVPRRRAAMTGVFLVRRVHPAIWGASLAIGGGFLAYKLYKRLGRSSTEPGAVDADVVEDETDAAAVNGNGRLASV